MPKAAPKKATGDLDRLQGTWYIATLEMDGSAAPPGGSIEIHGSRFQSLGMGATYEGDLRLDETVQPKTFDLAFTAGPEKGNTSRGIYELSDGVWKICFTVTGKTRPKKFATARGSGLALETLHREKPAAVEPVETRPVETKRARPAGADPAMDAISGEWAMVSNVSNGVPLDPQYVKAGRRKVSNGTMTVTVMGQTVLKARIHPDAAKTPHAIDYEMGGPNPVTQLGIYKLADGVLTTCIAAPGGKRPTEFSSEPDSGCTLSSWRLV